jgi:large subunit ribosomal protein L14e
MSCPRFIYFSFLQALIDGPTTGVPRQSYPYKHLVLTTFVVKDLPRAAGTSTVKKYLEKHDVDAKWKATSWAKKRAVVERRRALSDFARFKTMLHKRSRRDKVRKSLRKA